MNKKRLDSLRIRQLALVLGLAVVSLAYAGMSTGTTLMAAVTTRELPVYNEMEKKFQILKNINHGMQIIFQEKLIIP